MPLRFVLFVLAACVHPQPAAETTPPPAVMAEAVVAKPWPDTPRVDTPTTMQGTTWNDPYQWLEDGANPDVQSWVHAQDGYARDWLGRRPEREALKKRFAELYYVDSVSVPVQRGGRYFYTRTFADKEKGILYVRDANGERVLLDPNS